MNAKKLWALLKGEVALDVDDRLKGHNSCFLKRQHTRWGAKELTSEERLHGALLLYVITLGPGNYQLLYLLTLASVMGTTNLW